MDIRINNMDIRLNGMDMYMNGIPAPTPVNDILFRLDPALLFNGAEFPDWTCGGINSVNTLGTIGSYSTVFGNIVESPYSHGKTYYDSTTSETLEAPIRMDNLNIMFDKNQTVHSWINIKAPLKRKVYDGHRGGFPLYARMKSGNVLYFHQGGINKIYTVGYKCPYYLVDGEPANKYLYDVFQFVIGISQKGAQDRRFILTDFAYTFDTWYLISYVNENNILRLYVNGQPVKIYLTPIDVITNLCGNQYYSGGAIHNEIITQAGYGNNGLENLEGYFNYEVHLKKVGILSDKTGSKPTPITSFSTGSLNNGSTKLNHNKKYNKTNPFVNNGLIEIYSLVKTDSEIIQYYNDTNVYI